MLISFRPGNQFGNLGDLDFRRRRFDKKHIGASLEIGAGAVDRGVKSFDRNRIGTGNDDEIRIVQRVADRFELLHHLADRNDVLSS